MNVETIIPASITVNAEAFAKWQKAKQAAQALAKEADALRMECGFPETETLVSLLGVAECGKGSAVIVNGNGVPIGKVSVFWKDAYVVKAGFSSRIS